MKIVAKTAAGKIRLKLMGIDVRSAEDKNKKIPYWIDYTKLTVNGNVIFNKIIPAWHNKPCIYTTDAKTDEEITVEIEWLPHKETE